MKFIKLFSCFLIIAVVALFLAGKTINAQIHKNPAVINNGLPSFYLGNKNAPVTIYEFVSLACPHCAVGFKTLMKDIKPSYIDSGKVKLVIMPFPIFGESDIAALSILYHSKNNEQFFNLAGLYFNSQSAWVMSANAKQTIINYAKLSGFTDKDIAAYKSDTKTPKIIEGNANEYIKIYDIQGTPTSIIVKTGTPITNKSIRIVGDASTADFKKAINIVLKK